MENHILLSTLKYLEGFNTPRQLTELHLTRFFTTVELDDGSVGACASYYRISDAALSMLEPRLQDHCRNPFYLQDVQAIQTIMEETIKDKSQRDCLAASVIATGASALSAACIRSGGDEYFQVQSRRPKNWVGDSESALVVGFGGFLEPLIAEEQIKRVHVLDLFYDRRRDFGAKVADWAAQYPGKSITGSTHVKATTDLRGFDVLSITGSTLCNGTLEYFLENVRHDAIVILQGQSASLHPKVLFESGVTWVATTLKPTVLGRMARGGHDGEVMRPMLQGGLPWVYLFPRPGRRELDDIHRRKEPV